MKIFFDTEFTGLKQDAELLSIGIIAEDGRTFYAEKANAKDLNVDDWIKDNVIAHFTGQGEFEKVEDLQERIEYFLKPYKSVEVWSDCLAYDWVLFNNIWGHAFNIPKKIYYIPFDICTLMKIRGVDPDISREEFSGIKGSKHNALHDARAIKACYEKLVLQDKGSTK